MAVVCVSHLLNNKSTTPRPEASYLVTSTLYLVRPKPHKENLHPHHNESCLCLLLSIVLRDMLDGIIELDNVRSQLYQPGPANTNISEVYIHSRSVIRM